MNMNFHIKTCISIQMIQHQSWVMDNKLVPIMVKHMRIAFSCGKKRRMVMKDQEFYVGIAEVFILKKYMFIHNLVQMGPEYYLRVIWTGMVMFTWLIYLNLISCHF